MGKINFFDTRKSPAARLWQWFELDEKQGQESEELIKSILLNKAVGLMLEQGRSQEEVVKAIGQIDSSDPLISKIIIELYSYFELNYQWLIEEILGILTTEQLESLQQFLEKE